MTFSGGFAWLALLAVLLILFLGTLTVINLIDRQLEKVLKAITNKYELWGIMREASVIYRAKKKAKKEER